MGSYATLAIGSLKVASHKREPDALLMTVFRESDKCMIRTDSSKPEGQLYFDDDYWDQDEPITVIKYRCTVKVLRDRLDLLGFTLENVRRLFSADVENDIANAEYYSDLYDSDGLREMYGQRIAMLRELTVDNWLDGMREIKARGLEPVYHWNDESDEYRQYSPVVQYILGKYGAEEYGYPGWDIRSMLRLLAAICAEDEELVYDVTDLVQGGYLEAEEDLCAYADYQLGEQFVVSRRIIVLTEGITDQRFIKRSLSIVYPHLADYFTFMDFEGANIEGGAGALVGIVKAFVGAGIANRVVALLDNDTAAQVALRGLRA
jgi:hypothetical protein